VIGATTKRTMLIAATAGALLVLAACGDDGEASGPSKEEYIASANQLCVEGREAAEAVFQEVGFSGRPTPADAQRALQGLLPMMQESFGGREALEVPEGEEEAIEAIDDASAEAVAEFEGIAADRSESAALMSGQIPDPATEVDRLSGEYGLTECAGKD
jgi:ABC-type phosphate/phosphonate transport system substrate-binding protein